MFRAAAIIAAAVLALAGLWAARAVMMPVAFGWLIIALVWPVQRRLRAKLPQVIAVLVTTAVALLAIVAGGWLVVWAFGDIAQWVIANAARLQGLYMHAAELLERRGLYAAELFAEQVNVLWLVQVLRAIGGSLQGVLSFSIVTFVFVILGLLEVEPVAHRLRRIGNGQFGVAAIDSATEIAARLQTYMLVRLGMSVLTGLAFWAFAALDGIELQREWGVIAFVLNFIPFIGSFVATLLPALFAAAQFEALYAALVVFIVLNILQFVIGSYIEPRVAGTAVAVSPFMVLFAVFFRGMLWGVAGALIGVPVLIALAAVCTRHPAVRPIAILLSSDSGSRDE
jgi:AI-2 transport protein TqsA